MPVRFDAALAETMQRLSAMGAIAEHMVENVILTLTQRNETLLQSVYDDEKRMDSLQIEIDDRTVEMIAVYTPVAADLRLLLMIPRISGSLERIGDQAEKICKHVRDILAAEPVKPVVDIPKLAEMARGMLLDCLQAFTARSAPQAAVVLGRDGEVNAIRNRILDDLTDYMEHDPAHVRRALGLMTITRAVERVGDQAVDIAEATIYAVTGRDVRHFHERRDPQGTAGQT